MADKFRIGNVANAISGGLDLFIGREAEKEREASRRNWEMRLENIREARANARSEREFMERLSLNAQQFAMAEQRSVREAGQADARLDKQMAHQTGLANIASEQTDKHFFLRMEAEQRESLQKSLIDLNDQEKETLANVFDPEEKERLRQAFDDERERMIGSFALSMMDQAERHPDVMAFEPYRATSQQDVQGVLQSLGLGPSAAKVRANDIWKFRSEPGAGAGAGSGSNRRTTNDAGQPLNSNFAYKDEQGRIQGKGPRLQERLRLEAEQGQQQPQARPQAQPQQAPPPQATPARQMDTAQPGSLKSLFEPNVILNPDGTPKYPANEDSVLFKMKDWLTKPVPYGQ